MDYHTNMVEQNKSDSLRREFRIPRSLHHSLKIQASIENRTMTEIVIESIENYLKQNKGAN